MAYMDPTKSTDFMGVILRRWFFPFDLLLSGFMTQTREHVYKKISDLDNNFPSKTRQNEMWPMGESLNFPDYTLGLWVQPSDRRITG